MNIFLYDDYKQVLRAKIQSMPRRGRGQIEMIAKALNVHQSFISQVLNTERNLSEDQAYVACRYLNFADAQTEYFIALVQLARAETTGLKSIINRHLQRLKNQSGDAQKVDRNITSLQEEDKQIFYSHWSYMAVWLLTANPAFSTTEKISTHLHIPLNRIKEIVEFLVHVGLCIEKDGNLTINIKRTLVTRVNKADDIGKVTFDMLINCVVDNFTDNDIKKLQLGAVTWKHEELRLKIIYSKAHGKISDEKWKHLLFTGQLQTFVTEHSRISVGNL